MAQNIKVAEFDLDLKGILAEAQKYKEALDKIKKSQKELRKDGKESTTEYVANEARLKALNKEYRNRITVLGETAKGQQHLLSVQDRMTHALEQEAVTIAELRANNKLLNDLRNDTNIETEEGQAQLASLNKRLNENNALIKENVDNYTKQKIEIGDYKQQVKEALNETDAFTRSATGGFRGMFMAMTEAGGAGAFVSKGINAASRALIGLTKSALAFIATPIGAIIAVLAGAFLLVKNALDGNEERVQALTTAFKPLTGIVTALLNALKPLGEFLIDVMVFALTKVTLALEKAMEGIAKALDFLGFDSLASSVRDANEAMIKGANVARELAQAQYDLDKMQRESLLTSAKLKRVAEESKLLRDDETRSLAERLEASRAVTASENAMIASKMEIIKKQLEINRLLQVEGNTGKEILDDQARLLAQMEDIEAQQASLQRRAQRRALSIEKQVTQEQEEEQAKRVDNASKAMDARIKLMQDEYDYFVSQQGFRKLGAEEELQLAQELASKNSEILKEEFEANKISRLEYDTALLESKNKIGLLMAEQASENARLELQAIVDAQTEAIQKNAYLTEELLLQKQEDNDALLEAERAYQAQRLELGLISESDYNDFLNEKKEELRLLNKELEDERRENQADEELAQRALDFEDEVERMRYEKESLFDIERAIKMEQYELEQDDLDEKLQNNLISQNEYNLESRRIDKNRADAMVRIKQAEEQAKAQATAGLLDAVASVVDENSKTGKAIALAKAGMNLQEAITKDLALGFPQNAIAIARDTIIGGKAIKDILSTNIPSAKGSGSVSSGGTAPNIPTVNGASASDSATVLNQIDAQNKDSDVAEQTRRAMANGAREGIQEGMVDLTENKMIQANSEF